MKARVTQWIDTKTLRTWWGVQVRQTGSRWMNVSRDGKPAFFDLKCDAEGFAKVLGEAMS